MKRMLAVIGILSAALLTACSSENLRALLVPAGSQEPVPVAVVEPAGSSGGKPAAGSAIRSGNGMAAGAPAGDMAAGSTMASGNSMMAPANGMSDMSAAQQAGTGSLAGVFAGVQTFFGADGTIDPSHVEIGWGDEAGGYLAVTLAAGVPEVGGWLAQFPDWRATAWQDGDDGRYYNLDFYSDEAEEWLGWATINVADERVEDYFVPRELTAEEFQTGRDRVEAFVLQDEAILARLVDLSRWEYDTYYNRWDAVWEMYFWQGLEEITVVVATWEGELYVEDIYNPQELEAAEAAENERNEAVSLAWQAEGIDQALADSHNWRTYVSPQGDGLYAVSFATDERELFFALVDVAAGQVLESAAGDQ